MCEHTYIYTYIYIYVYINFSIYIFIYLYICKCLGERIWWQWQGQIQDPAHHRQRGRGGRTLQRGTNDKRWNWGLTIIAICTWLADCGVAGCEAIKARSTSKHSDGQCPHRGLDRVCCPQGPTDDCLTTHVTNGNGCTAEYLDISYHCQCFRGGDTSGKHIFDWECLRGLPHGETTKDGLRYKSNFVQLET